ncbi:MAG: 3-oxoacyl-[acyl-carrier-protein] reductase [Gemmatimonadaceae bacterium]|nr:3-oxoacyl-[acyl-carrier-protein] reductase [Gemmatimonadaceae bacterium]MCC6429598.1 3-oxoacyl-[acyl-carrier-protein] reductase [Gemmatimonadaceae bacterium]
MSEPVASLGIQLTGRVALVTGSTRGIGRAIAQTLAAAGAQVAVTGRNQAQAEAVAGEIAAMTSSTVRGYAADLTEVAQATRLVESVERDFGQLDILVNNAGMTRDNLLMRLKDDDWDAVMNANLRAAFATCRAASRGMMKRRWGRIINVASVVGLIGNKGQANYAASKAGLIGMTKSIAKELASRNILANVVAPGFIETDMTAAMTAEARASMSAGIPLERLGTPEDVAGMVAVLASDLTRYVTGQVFVVDGGLVM